MRGLTVEQICAVCGGTLRGGPAPAGEISAVTTDSREAAPGALFAAIPGARTDGHDHAAEAVAKGAVCCLAQRVPEGCGGCVILVPDTLRALQRLAGWYRRQFDIPVVGVTGSAGKTTVKEMTAAVLARRFAVHKTAGNHNNDLGVALTLLGLRDSHGAAVVELGISHPGDMDRIAAAAAPTAAVYTNIGDAHLEYLGSREGVLREKSRLSAFLPPDGPAILNGDDPLLRTLAGRKPCLTYGRGADCEVRAEELRTEADGSTAFTLCAASRRTPVRVPAFGEHMVYAALAGIAAGLALGLTPEEAAAGAADYVPVGSRGRLLRSDGLTVIDDCYNSNPTSAAAAIRALAKLPAAGRRVCILGDMLELGADSARLHRETGALAAAEGMDLVLACGAEAAALAEGAGAIGRYFPDKAALLPALPALLRRGDTVLVKASRGMRFEEITAALLPAGT